ncbi:hypothetical protein BDN72DRAFT_419833 [Pluteus cervinus]|uniref:Uncharacterized protein n=1 Tax=Pluteus cervinus TaxID=181527 RepID=A0ACD3AAN7_9AGAR|nr:hypothetical protein BDN72DRAFT_419833 [Pluteus cervinus]
MTFFDMRYLSLSSPLSHHFHSLLNAQYRYPCCSLFLFVVGLTVRIPVLSAPSIMFGACFNLSSPLRASLLLIFRISFLSSYTSQPRARSRTATLPCVIPFPVSRLSPIT